MIPRTEWRGLPCSSSTTSRPCGDGTSSGARSPHSGKPALAGGDQGARKKVSVGKTFAEVKRHWRGLACLRQNGKDGVGILARYVQAAVVAELYVERVDHRRNVLGCHHYVGEVESVAVAAIPGNMAVLAPGVGNVEIIANQREAASNVQREGIGRRIKQ